MLLKLFFKNIVSDLSKEEILIIDTIISKMEYSRLLELLKNILSKEKIDESLKSLIEKKIILTDEKDFFNKINDNEIDKLYNDIKNKKNYFEILELRTNSSLDEIKATYFKFLKKFHPDAYKKSNDKVEKKLSYISVELGNMYNILKSKEKRREYIKSINLALPNTKTVDNSKENIEKGVEFYNIANDEFLKNNIDNSLRYLKLSLYYDKNNIKSIKLLKQATLRKEEIEIKKIYSNIENLFLDKKFEEIISIIDSIPNEKLDNTLKKYKIKAYNILDPEKYKDLILVSCVEILESDNNKENHELYINFLEKFKSDKLEEEINKFIEKYPKSKATKNYQKTKKRSIWNIF